MKKEIFAASDFKRKPYATPQAKVVEIAPAAIICQSQGRSSSESYLDGDTSNWFNN